MDFGTPFPKGYEPDFGDEPVAEPAPVQQDQPEPAVRTAQPEAPAQPQPEIKFDTPFPKGYEPEFDEEPAPEQHGTVSNIARGIGERGLQLVGKTAGTAATAIESGGDWLAQNVGNIWIDQNNALQIRQMTPEETAGDNTWLSTKLREVQQGLDNPDLGYNPATTWDDVKKAPLRNIVPFALEQGIVSAPDMVSAIRNAPAYIFEQAGEIGQQRAENEGGREMTFGDIVKAAPAAVISQWMEKLGTEKILGKFAGGEAVLTELKQLPADLFKTLITEGGTEAAQQAAQYTGGAAFTDKGMDWWEMAEQVAQAGLVGMIFGPAARAPFAGLEIATAPKTEATETPPVGEAAPPADPNAAEGQSTPANIGGPSTPPQPVGAGPTTSAAPTATPNQAKVTTPVVIPAEAPVDPAAASVLNPQPVENPKVQPTPDTGEDYRKVTSPDFVEPSLRDEEDEFDTNDEPVDIDFDAPTVNVAGAGQDTANAINTPAAAAPQTTAQAIDAGVAKIVAAVQQATPAPAAPQVAAPQTPAPVVQEQIPRPQVQEQPAASPVAAAAATEDVATLPVAGAEPVASPVTAQPEPLGPEPTAVPETTTAQQPQPAQVEARKSFWDQFPTQTGQAIAAEPVAEEEAPPRRPGTLGVKRNAPVEVAEMKTRERPANEQARARAEARQSRNVGETTTKTDLHGALVDEARGRAADAIGDQEFAKLSEDHRFTEVAEAAARDVAPNADENQSIAGNARGLSQQLVDNIKDRFQKIHEADKTQRAEAEEAALKREQERKLEEEAHRAATAKAQERERGVGKSANAIENESNVTTKRAYEAELEKPESERDPDLIAWGEAYEARKAHPGKSKVTKTVEARKVETDKLEAAKARRVAKARERDRVEEEARFNELLETERQRLRDEERAREGEEKTKAEERAAAERQLKKEAKERKAKTQPVLSRIIAALKLHPSVINSMATVKAFVAQVQSALKSIDPEFKLAGTVDEVRFSPEENFAIFAKRVAAGQEPGMGADEVAVAKSFLDAGDIDNLYDFITENRQGGDSAAVSYKEGAHSVVEGGKRKPQLDSDYSGSRNIGVGTTEAEFEEALRGGRQVTITHKGVKHTITVLQQMSGREAARYANRLSPFKGLTRLLRTMHNRKLRQMVGDTQVLFIPHSELVRITGKDDVAGSYLTTTDKSVAAGQHGIVLISKEAHDQHGDARAAHTIEHELTHAATDFAMRNNYRGTLDVVTKMLAEFKQQLRDSGIDPSTIYGTTDPYEFVAEAFSNAAFQKMLSEHPITESLARKIGIPSDRRPNWWKAFTAMVRSAMGMDTGGRGTMTYMEGVLALHPDLMMSLDEQQRRAANPDQFDGDYDARPGSMSPTSETFEGYDFSGMHLMAQSQVQARIDKRLSSTFTGYGRRFRNAFLMTTKEMQRHVTRLVGAAHDASFNAMADLLLSRDHMMRQLRTTGENTAAALNEMYRTSAIRAQAVVDSIYQSTLSGADPSKLLTDPENSWVSKKGVRHRAIRRRHREARAAYLALDQGQRDLWHNIIDFHRQQQDDRTKAAVRSIIEDAIAKGAIKLPRGVSLDEAENFVTSGKIDENPAQWSPISRELAIYNALGTVGKTLKNTAELRKVKGVYAPLTRQGKYFFTARENIATPAGATRQAETDHEQVFAFRNKKDMEKYVDTSDHKITNISMRVVDQTTGKTTNAHGDKLTEHDPNTVKEYVVRAMDKSMHMGDNLADLKVQSENLAKNGHTIDRTPSLLDEHMNGGASSVLPLNIRQLLQAIDRSSKTDAVKQANRAAVMDAYIRTMAGSRAQHRTLKRIGMAGHSGDMIQSILSTNAAMAAHMANLHFMPKIAKADAELDTQMNTTLRNDPRLVQFQEMVKELRKRRDSVYKYDGSSGGFQRAANAALTASFMTHLASPAFAIFNQMQLFAVAAPVLAMEGGSGRTARNMLRAMRDMGVAQTWGRGVSETGKEFYDFVSKTPGLLRYNKNVARANISHHANTVDAIKRNNAKNLGAKLKGMDKMLEMGLSSDQALDVEDMSEYGKTRAEKFVHRAARVARQSTEAVEAVNRHVTFLTAIDNAFEMGMSEDQAINYALHKVEQTQGGYSAANNPTVMNHPFGRMALQFKKYGLMYGQLYWGNMARAMNINGATSKAERIQAAKTVAALSMMGVAMSGMMGLPIMEVARIGNVIAQMFGGDDWDKRKSDAELALQRLFKMIGMGDVAGNKLAEMAFHGVSRLAGVETQTRLGNDSLLIFSDPKSSSTNDMLLWGAKNVLGAPIQMALDTYDFTQTGEMSKLPLPKFMKDGMKAYKAAYTGKKSPTGATTYTKPTGWSAGTIMQGVTGVSPSAPQRQYEAGGSGIKAKEKATGKAERTTAVQSWLNAETSKERDAAWKKIQSGYNKGKSGKDQISMGDLMKAKKRRDTVARKAAAEEGASP
jgi:hypothetical protein